MLVPWDVPGRRYRITITHLCAGSSANSLSIPPAMLEPIETTEEEGRRCSLVNAGLCVRDLVQAGDLKPEGVSPLSFVHVVPEGQDHLQQLLQAAALEHCLGASTDGCRERGAGCHLQATAPALHQSPALQCSHGQNAATSSLHPCHLHQKQSADAVTCLPLWV